MKKGFVLPFVLVIVLVVMVGFFAIFNKKGSFSPEQNISETIKTLVPNRDPEPSSESEIDRSSVFVSGLEVPWAIAFLPDGGMLVTERKGRVRFVSQTGELRTESVLTLSSVRQVGESGLQGITLHPNFAENKFVYLYYTYSEGGQNTLNQVSRFTFNDNKLEGEKIIVDGIPGASNHDGGRIKFGPDKFLYITTGDAQEPSFAQDKNSLAGKILRVTDSGDPAPGNPFGNRTYSYGHRNPQGIVWDDNGGLWSSEHGPSGAETGNDEVNKITSGANYGWPDIRGTQQRDGMTGPIIESGRGNTWAPAGIAYLSGSLYFAGLRGQALYQLDNLGVNPDLKTHFKNEYGRLREVTLGPDGMLYVTTSNRDGRGSVKQGDDKIIKVNPAKL